ncbi:hypothetical protein niasHT_026764 [Heterodera trifolii]|uniref:Uncharacterized protein n=1 Tax=Heterodera trifolii TaxID=157864 RepID=A0ABD2K930_9BILA
MCLPFPLPSTGNIELLEEFTVCKAGNQLSADQARIFKQFGHRLAHFCVRLLARANFQGGDKAGADRVEAEGVESRDVEAGNWEGSGGDAGAANFQGGDKAGAGGVEAEGVESRDVEAGNWEASGGDAGA